MHPTKFFSSQLVIILFSFLNFFSNAAFALAPSNTSSDPLTTTGTTLRQNQVPAQILSQTSPQLPPPPSVNAEPQTPPQHPSQNHAPKYQLFPSPPWLSQLLPSTEALVPREDIFEYVDQVMDFRSLGEDTNPQLKKDRSQISGGTDLCRLRDDQGSFSDVIGAAIEDRLNPKELYDFNAFIRKAYRLQTAVVPIGFFARPFCAIDSDSLKHMLGEGYVPSIDTISRLKRFTQKANEVRTEYLAEVERATVERRQLNPNIVRNAVDVFGTLMGCLAYKESLSQAGDSGELKIKYDNLFLELLKNTPTLRQSLQRPQGIVAQVDRPGGYFQALRVLESQKSEKKITEEEFLKKVEELKNKNRKWWVIGVYQFRPDGTGNIGMCIEKWNQKFPGCSIKSSSKTEVVSALSAPAQTFNIFCGIEKLLHSFHTQLHTTSADGTDLSNRIATPISPPIGAPSSEPVDKAASPSPTSDSSSSEAVSTPLTAPNTSATPVVTPPSPSPTPVSSPSSTPSPPALPPAPQQQVKVILKAPAERCLSLVSRGGTGKVYAHFGPLRNGTKEDLAQLMSCVGRTLDRLEIENRKRIDSPKRQN